MSDLNTQLKTFLCVAHLGSFRRAADELHVTQAAITSRIQALESWLGFSAFHRHRRGAELTSKGKRFLNYARNAVDMIEHGREESRRTASYRAHFRFTSQYLLLKSVSLDWVDWMEQHAADVSISIDSSPSMSAASAIRNGLIDLAIGYQSRVTNGVTFEQLFNERLIMVTSHKSVKNWKDNFIPIGWDDEFDETQRNIMGALEDQYRINLEFIDLAPTILQRRPGSAYVVERTSKSLIERGIFKIVPDTPLIIRPAYVLYPNNPIHPEILETALNGIRYVTAGLDK